MIVKFPISCSDAMTVMTELAKLSIQQTIKQQQQLFIN